MRSSRLYARVTSGPLRGSAEGRRERTLDVPNCRPEGAVSRLDGTLIACAWSVE